MLNISHRIQSSQSQMPNRSAKGRSIGLRFGVLSRDQLQPYQDVLNRWAPEQYKPNDLAQVQDTFLSRRAQNQLEQVHNQLATHRKFQALYKKGDLGPTGFASSLLFELYTLVALRENVIPAKFIQDVTKKTLPGKDKRGEKAFTDFLKEVQTELEKEDNALSESKIEFFQNLIGGKPKDAKTVLNLIAARLVIQHGQKSGLSGLDDAKAELKSAASSFNSTFPWYSPKRIQTWLMTEAYSYLPFLPTEWFRSQIMSLVRGRVAKELEYEDLVKTIEEKQLRYLEVAYAHPGTPKHEIKRMLYGIELLNEAAIVEHAKIGHYKRHRDS